MDNMLTCHLCAKLVEKQPFCGAKWAKNRKPTAKIVSFACFWSIRGSQKIFSLQFFLLLILRYRRLSLQKLPNDENVTGLHVRPVFIWWFRKSGGLLFVIRVAGKKSNYRIAIFLSKHCFFRIPFLSLRSSAFSEWMKLYAKPLSPIVRSPLWSCYQ